MSELLEEAGCSVCGFGQRMAPDSVPRAVFTALGHYIYAS